MKLTAIKKDNQKKTVYEIYLDGEYAFDMDESNYISYYLYDKDEISKREIEEIQYKVEYTKGVSCAIKYLARQKKTQKQTEDYLIQKGFGHKVIEGLLIYLNNEKYLDDIDYARRYIKTRIKISDKSLNIIGHELSQRGISEEISERFLVLYEEEEYERALKAAVKKFDNKKENNIRDMRKTLEKIYRFLVYRGYKQDIIYSVIKEMGYEW